MGLLEQILGSVLAKGGGSQATGGLGDLLGGSQGSGGLGDLLGGVLGGGGGKSGGAHLLVTLLPLVLMMLQNRGGAAGGGLGGLLQRLQAGGLGQQADSWVRDGDNEPISAEDLRNALGPDAIHQLATQAGVSDEEASGGLASLVPELVNQLTPEGRLPAGGQVDTAFADLRRSLGM